MRVCGAVRVRAAGLTRWPSMTCACQALRRPRLSISAGARTLDALSAFAQSGGAGSTGASIPEPPNAFELALEWFISISGDVQTILMRKTVPGALLFCTGVSLGVLCCVAIFVSCIDNSAAEFVQYNDPTTGQFIVVPWKSSGLASSPTAPTPRAAEAANASADTPQAAKKQQ